MLPVLLLLLLLFSFRKLGGEWSVDQEVTDELEAFTCLMYGHAREKSVNTVRSIMLRKMLGENEELTTKSSTLQRQPCSTHCQSELPSCQLQTSSQGDLFAPQSLRS